MPTSGRYESGSASQPSVRSLPSTVRSGEQLPTTRSNSTKTTGRISSTFEKQVKGIGVNVLSRDAAGQVVAADNGWIEFVAAGSDANFMVEGWSEQKPNVAPTEVYYDGFLPSTE